MAPYFDGPAVTSVGPDGVTGSHLSPIQDINHLVSTELGAPATYGRFVYAQASAAGFGIAVGSTGSSAYSGLGAAASFAFANSCWDDDGLLYAATVNTTTGAVSVYCVSSTGSVLWTNTTLTCITGANRNVSGMVICGNFLFVAIRKSAGSAAGACIVAKLYKANGVMHTAAWKSLAGLSWSTNSVNCLAALGTDVWMESTYDGGFILKAGHDDGVGPGGYNGYLFYNQGSGLTNNNKSKLVTDGVGMYVIASTATGQIKKLGANLGAGNAAALIWSSTACDPCNSITYDKKTSQLIALATVAPMVRKINLSTGALTTSAIPTTTSFDDIDCDSQGTFVMWKNSQAAGDVQGLSSTLGTLWGPSTLANALHVGASVNKGTNTVTPPTTGARFIRPLLVSGGELRRFSTTGTTVITGGGSFNSTTPQIFSAQNGLNMFYVDGGASYFYYKGSTDTVVPWVATTGTLPVDTPVPSAARLIATWRGRSVLSGFRSSPQMWYMSKQFDAFNWEYSPATTTQTQATNGNVSNAGLVGDYINCIISYTDDTMLFGCDHSLWILTGDPMVGGQFDNVSDTIGMLWGRPFAKDPFGQVYFMSNTGAIFKMTPGALPQPVSQNILKKLENVDLSTVVVRMAWSLQYQGLHVFVTPLNLNTPAQHFFYEERTGAWWVDRFHWKYHNPFAVHVYDGDAAEDRHVMLGGKDGSVRIVSETAGDDDGKPIQSVVWLGPLSTKQMDDVLLKDMQATLGVDSWEVSWAVHVGRTVEEAKASASVRSGTWSPGRNKVNLVNRSGFAIFLKLSATAPFAIERIRARYTTLGPERRKS